MRATRSLLYVPANRPKMLDKAPSCGADALILDLEDSVPVQEKAEARRIARDYTERWKEGEVVYVRVNHPDTGMLADDLEAVAVDGLRGVMLPKVDSPETVLLADSLLAELEARRALPSGGIELVTNIESARGVHFAYEIVTAAARVGSVSVASARDGDMQKDLGCLWSEEGTEMLYVRSKVLVDARAAGIANPIDGVYANIRDEAGLARSAQMARRLGYRGKSAIHPNQVGPINRIFMPSPEELEYYRRVLDRFEAATAQGSASTSIDGNMIDYAMAESARRMLAWSESLGAPE